MLVLVPLLVLAGLAVLSWHESGDARTGVVTGVIIWWVLVVGITEALSVCDAITMPAVTGAWGVVLLGLACLGQARYRSRRRAASRPKGRTGALAAGAPTGLDRPPFAWWAGVALIVLAVGVVAWVAPPNNSDSMIYHMARVAHWRQNHSVAHYPTNSLRQLWLQPAAEYAVLQFQVLSGGDRWANSVQWLAMIGSVLAASLVARQLGAGAAGQALAAVFVATLPMGILQASGTQNDYVAAFFLVSLAFFLLRFPGWSAPGPGLAGGQPPRNTRVKEPATPAPGPTGAPASQWGPWANAFLAGAALGLGLLTKATDSLFMMPLLLLPLWQLARRRSALLLWQLLLVGVLALALNVPFLARNQQLFGSPLGPDTAKYRNATLGVRTTVSNVVRNAAMHLAFPNEAVAHRLTALIAAGLHGVGIYASDPRTSFEAADFAISPYPLHENYAGNPLHLLLIIAVLPALLFMRRLHPWAGARALALAIIAGALLFCAYLRWQPWGNRLELPLFVLAAAPVATAIKALRPRRWPHILAGALMLASLPWVSANRSRPLYSPWAPSIFTASREWLYFVNAPNRARLLSRVRYFAGVVRQEHYDSAGLVEGEDEGEYLVWAVLQTEVPWPVRIEHLNVRNASAALQRQPRFQNFEPALVFSMSEAVQHD